ncbi:MAG: class I mannose-6-phosphate isomerase [Bacteroidaceae bacterium]|nr:class I mannose-6-phosphate isomerase [Bacteroidaceae bacterium]
MTLYPLLFQPNLHPVVWGGYQLRPYKGLKPSNQPIGESWEVSLMPESTSIISNGEWAGRTLSEVISEQPDAILGKAVNERYGGQLPLLIKLIDAKQDLSIQVHPNDQMAMREHGKSGKNEMWYVIKADAGSHIYAGFKKTITPEEYHRRIADGTIMDVLADYPVKAGDVFYLPAGSVHAICGGILLAEVQQSSDVTYRIYDYNRLGMDGKLRELHTELASQALDYTVYPNYRLQYPNEVNKVHQIIQTHFFNVQLINATEKIHRDMRKNDSFIISMCLEGDCKLYIKSTGEELLLKQGSTTLIPASLAEYSVEPIGQSTRLLDAYIDNS